MYDELGTYLDMSYDILQEYLNYLDKDINNCKDLKRLQELENHKEVVINRLYELNENNSSLQS